MVIRSVGERTTDLCCALARRQISDGNIFIINESPFTEAIRKSFEIAIESKRKWAYIIDADVLIRPGVISDLINYAENADNNIFKIEGKVIDKFIGSPREAGTHLYRTALIPQALGFIPDPFQAIRPETDVRNAMNKLGYGFVKTNIITGLHDFEQYYSDIFRKCFIQSRKHHDRVTDIMPYWEKLSQTDPDYKIAIEGFKYGITFRDRVAIDSNLPIFDEFHRVMQSLSLKEKDGLKKKKLIAENAFRKYYNQVIDKTPMIDKNIADLNYTSSPLTTSETMITSLKKPVKKLLNKVFYTAFPELQHKRPGPQNTSSDLLTQQDILEYINNTGDDNIFRFLKIKKITRGFLAPEVYREIYLNALNAPPGNIIDIGPAQGGSSISLCLGIKEAGNENSKVYSIEKGEGSDALASKEKNINESVLVSNIRKYGLAGFSEVLMGDVKEVSHMVPSPMPVSGIFIDADGALDRDFNLFFNQMTDNAFVIIDDYINEINEFARNNYLKWKTQEEMDNYVKRKGAANFVDLCPLGKEYTTYRFVNYFLEKELVVKEKIIGQTFFGRKRTGAAFTEKHYEEMRVIRNEILDEYYGINTGLKRI